MHQLKLKTNLLSIRYFKCLSIEFGDKTFDEIADALVLPHEIFLACFESLNTILFKLTPQSKER